MKKDQLILLMCHQNEIPLIGISRCNLSAPGEPETRGYVVEFFEDDEKFLATQEQMKKFILGETIFTVKERDWIYSSFEEKMKPSEEQLNSYLGT